MEHMTGSWMSFTLQQVWKILKKKLSQTAIFVSWYMKDISVSKSSQRVNEPEKKNTKVKMYNILTRKNSCETWPWGGSFAPKPSAGNSLSLYKQTTKQNTISHDVYYFECYSTVWQPVQRQQCVFYQAPVLDTEWTKPGHWLGLALCVPFSALTHMGGKINYTGWQRISEVYTHQRRAHNNVKMEGMAEVGAPISLDGVAVHPDCWCICPCYLHFAPENPEDGEMYLLVPAHPGCPEQSPQSRKMIVFCVCESGVILVILILTYKSITAYIYTLCANQFSIWKQNYSGPKKQFLHKKQGLFASVETTTKKWTSTIHKSHLACHQKLSLKLLPVFTSTWQSLFTELSMALHLGICLVCCASSRIYRQEVDLSHPLPNFLSSALHDSSLSVTAHSLLLERNSRTVYLKSASSLEH